MIDQTGCCFSTSDDLFYCLYRAGWSVGDVALTSPTGIVWLVTGRNGENAIEARGVTAAEAWWQAIEQAGALGMDSRM